MQRNTETETNSRQAELQAVLADKGLEAATETAKSHALADMAGAAQYGPEYFEAFELHEAAGPGDAYKGGQAWQDGDLILARIDTYPISGLSRITGWARRGLSRAIDIPGGYMLREIDATPEALAERALEAAR